MQVQIKVKKAESLKDKIFGMILSENSDGIFFKTRFGIHTFFMKDPIDVLILNQKNEVVRIKSVKPNRIYLWNLKYDRVVELPDGFCKRLGIKMGDVINLN